METTINLNSVLQRAEDLVSCDLEGEMALLSVSRGKYYGLNTMGSRVWLLLEKPRPLAAICTFLEQEFEVASGRCRQEVLAFVQDLAREGLVTVTDVAPG